MPETGAQGCRGRSLPRWVVLETQVGGGSSHNWPSGNGGGNESLLTWNEKRYSCPFSNRKKTICGVGSWDSGGCKHGVGLPGVLRYWLLYFFI